jgi:hypothetical protein
VAGDGGVWSLAYGRLAWASSAKMSSKLVLLLLLLLGRLALRLVSCARLALGARQHRMRADRVDAQKVVRRRVRTCVLRLSAVRRLGSTGPCCRAHAQSAYSCSPTTNICFRVSTTEDERRAHRAVRKECEKRIYRPRVLERDMSSPVYVALPSRALSLPSFRDN